MRNLRARFILTAGAFACLAIYPSEPASAQRMTQLDSDFAHGVEEYKAQRFKSAAQCFEACMRKNPKNSDALVYDAASYERAGETERARALFHHTIAVFPDSPAAAKAAEYLKKLPERSAEPLRAAATTPGAGRAATTGGPASAEQIDGEFKKADSFMQEGHWNQAEKCYLNGVQGSEKLGTRHPKLLEALQKAGDFYDKRQNFARACAFADRELALKDTVYGRQHPETVGTMMRVAPIFVKHGDYSRAEELYRRSVDYYQAELDKAERRNKPDLTPERNALIGAISGLSDAYKKQGNVGEGKQLDAQVRILQQSAQQPPP